MSRDEIYRVEEKLKSCLHLSELWLITMDQYGSEVKFKALNVVWREFYSNVHGLTKSFFVSLLMTFSLDCWQRIQFGNLSRGCSRLDLFWIICTFQFYLSATLGLSFVLFGWGFVILN